MSSTGIETLHFERKSLHADQSTDGDPDTVGSILSSLGEDAYCGPVGPSPRVASTVVDVRLRYAMQGEDDLHMRELFETLETRGAELRAI